MDNANFKNYIHYNREIENAVLGAILIESNAFSRVYSLLDEECFYCDDNKFLFRSLKWMFDKRLDIDVLTVAHFVLSKGNEKWLKISNQPFGYYLTKITGSVCSSAHIETHSKMLRELWNAREMTKLQVEAGNDISLDGALEIKKRIEKIFDISAQDEWLTMEEIITTRLLKRMDDIKLGKVVSFVSEFPTIDNSCTIDAGDFIIIGARPSQGKTALAMQLAKNLASNDAIVGVLSLETISEKLAGRLISGASTLEYWKIWKNKLTESEYDEFYKTSDRLIGLNLLINDRPSATAMDIRIAANKLKNKFKDRKMIIIIDYLQLITPEKSKQSQRHQEIGEISRALRLLTLELKDTAVIALAQLNRESEKDGKPKSSQLRESGSLEQDADKIWLLHRDREKEEELRANGQMDDYEAELIIAKNKEGWTGTVDMLFSPQRMTFREKVSQWQPVKNIDTSNYHNDNPF